MLYFAAGSLPLLQTPVSRYQDHLQFADGDIQVDAQGHVAGRWPSQDTRRHTWIQECTVSRWPPAGPPASYGLSLEGSRRQWELP